MITIIWLPIILGFICVILAGTLNKMMKNKIKTWKYQENIKSDSHKPLLKYIIKALVYVIGFIFTYTMFYSFYMYGTAVEEALKGNEIASKELDNSFIDKEKGDNIVGTFIISFLSLSTIFAAGFFNSIFQFIKNIRCKNQITTRTKHEKVNTSY